MNHHAPSGGVPPYPPGPHGPQPPQPGPYPYQVGPPVGHPGGPVLPPYPPPRPPSRHRGSIAAVVIGVVAVLAVSALLLTVMVNGTSSSDDRVADPAPGVPTMPAVPLPQAPGDGDPAPSPVEMTALRTAMQAFVDAVNSRNVPRIQAAVCSAVRPQVTAPLDIIGNVVLEDLTEVSVTGDSAESTVSTHLELGNQRSTSKMNEEIFTRESGTWFVCPGAQPDMPA
ncbi:hypothetical protein AAFP35_06170 [Gordonia sp. CPCC 206044]|uniref:hypothetical protein n=1 Tax=Gordonia sp. CPCC 206044 TaxID=3140793 RepID=UPI003AF35901